MITRKLFNLSFSFMIIVSLLFGGVTQAAAQDGDPPPPPPPLPLQDGVITAEERQAVAEANAAAGLAPDMAMTEMDMTGMTPGEVPHYYGPYPNYANSPQPVINYPEVSTFSGNSLVDRAYATDFVTPAATPVPVFVVIAGSPLPDGMLEGFQTLNQALKGGSPGPSAGNSFNAYVLRPTSVANEYQVVFNSGTLVVPPLADPAVSEVVTYPVTPGMAVQAGDLLAFYGAGIPVDIVASGTDIFSYPAPAGPEEDTVITVGDASFPIYVQARTYSFGAVIGVQGDTPEISGGMRKFVDGLPGLGAANANNLGQYIPVAEADTTTYPGSDYYEIALVEYQEQMHSDLPPTTLRGYVQLETSVIQGSHYALPDGYFGVDTPHYLGPAIVATKDKPVRILFRNLLPVGEGGNLFLPVDATVMGSGMGPAMGGMMEMDPQNPMCGNNPKPAGCYTENRATLHLHGGISPWISDGTPHQWVTPADENTPYPEGVSVSNVPDMPDPGPGAMTFFYTNQQSARLMFYHDHAWGITRLNVYAGEAAPYIITDDTEQALIDNGLIPDAAETIPLVVQDKTFVPPIEQLAMQDPTWDQSRWGGEGGLWLPHVYVPAQNPGDSSGVNQFGRWAYGPWFWPPTTNVDYGPIDNPYYDPACDSDVQWCEPPLIPGVPFNSMGMEAFMDTPVINGTAYPTITLEPKSYRFRILNAANDRFFNLSLYQAIDANGNLCDASNSNPAPESTGEACTEVALNPAEVAGALDDPAGIFPTPVSGTEGPDWIQIGTEGGFLPAPAVIPAQFTTWVTDPTVFNAGNVDQHSLLIGPAERADVVVDFSQFAGQTLILYNDAPAAFPARDPRYDYYTGNADLVEIGGTPPTLPGYGPNTRTVMQIKISGGAGSSFNLSALQNAFKSESLGGMGVFENGQHPIVVGQAPYNSAYGTSFSLNGPLAGLVQIFNTSFTFKTLLGDTLTMPLQPKQIQDEMGEAFEKEYGRMSGYLGLEAPGANANIQNMILYPYVNPASEIFDGIELPPGVEVTPISSADDGSQIWKITHNGVDTHPIHFHLYDVQVINRVGWDGIIRRPDPNELGWKDTVRISPLEDTIVAMRPVVPKIPFGVPDSERPLNPMMPLGSTAMFNSTDANGNPIPPIINQIVNFGWEYVWHCHILSHEEMDMMRPVIVNVARSLPEMPVLSLSGDPGSPIVLDWTDGTPVNYLNLDLWGDPANEIGFRVERATGTGDFETLTVALANATNFTDNSTVAGESYRYRVVAFNEAGDSPSAIIPVGAVLAPPADPSNLAASLQANGVDLNWTDNADNETGFDIERAIVTGGITGTFSGIDSVGADVTTFTDTTVLPDTNYAYRVFAFNLDGNSAPSNIAFITTPQPPAAPTNLVTTVQGSLTTGPRVRLTFRDNQNGGAPETGFQVFRSDNGGAFAQIATLPPRAGVGNVTYFDYGVVGGGTYEYYVVTIRESSASLPSNTAVAALPPVPAAPSNFLGTTRLTNATSRIDLSWTDNSNNESRFVIQRDTDPAFPAPVTFNRGANSTAWAQTGIAHGTTYYYRIATQNPYGFSEWINLDPFPIVTPVGAAPAAPSNFTATTTATSNTRARADLSWTDNSDNETRFVVQRATDAAFTTGVVTYNRAANSTAFVNTRLLRNRDYYYRIAAQNQYGQSEWVNIAPFPVTTP